MSLKANSSVQAVLKSSNLNKAMSQSPGSLTVRGFFLSSVNIYELNKRNISRRETDNGVAFKIGVADGTGVEKRHG